MAKLERLTLEEIEAIPKNVLTPADVAGYLCVGTGAINCASKAGTVPWAYQLGTRTIIPKNAFVNYHRYGAVVRDTGYRPEGE